MWILIRLLLEEQSDLGLHCFSDLTVPVLKIFTIFMDCMKIFKFITDEQMRRYLMQADQPADAKLLRVAILGAPNAGKSTLVNNLVNWKVSN